MFTEQEADDTVFTWVETHVPGIFPYMLPVGLALPVAEPDLGGYSLSWREIGIFKHLR